MDFVWQLTTIMMIYYTTVYINPDADSCVVFSVQVFLYICSVIWRNVQTVILLCNPLLYNDKQMTLYHVGV